MPEVLRLVTVHPILVHITLGALPLAILAYAIAAWTWSERWTFVADVTLAFTAIATVATAAFGLVSFLVLEWPGGLDLWRWLHLGFGAGTAALLLVLAAIRLRARRRRPASGVPSLAAALAVGLVAAFAGWIGGEVLVYRAGMAVVAAGNGALAPPLGTTDEPPADLDEAMHRLRGHWATSLTTLAEMIVEHPTDRKLAELQASAREIAATAHWIASREPPSQAGEPVAGAAGDRHPVSGRPEGRGSPLAAEAATLERLASALAAAAGARDLPRATAIAGSVSETCASCHREHRWDGHH